MHIFVYECAHECMGVVNIDEYEEKIKERQSSSNELSTLVSDKAKM